MLQESPGIPHTWTQWFWVVVATVLGYAGSSIKEWIARKRSPAEERKTDAETRQIDTATNISLMQAASDALTKACRLQDERDHWERKAASLENQNQLLNVEIESMDKQMRRMDGFIKAKGWKLSDLDTPKD